MREGKWELVSPCFSKVPFKFIWEDWSDFL